jgi:hypothetical protein
MGGDDATLGCSHDFCSSNSKKRWTMKERKERGGSIFKGKK